MKDFPHWNRKSSRRRVGIAVLLALVLVAGIWLIGGNLGTPNSNPFLTLSWSETFQRFIELFSDSSSDEPDPEFEAKRSQYGQMLTDLHYVLDSARLQQLADAGRPSLERQINASIDAAASAFDEVDVDSALRILGSAMRDWIDASSELFDETAEVATVNPIASTEPLNESLQSQAIAATQGKEEEPAKTAAKSPSIEQLVAVAPVVIEKLPEITEAKSESALANDADSVTQVQESQVAASERNQNSTLADSTAGSEVLAESNLPVSQASQTNRGDSSPLSESSQSNQENPKPAASIDMQASAVQGITPAARETLVAKSAERVNQLNQIFEPVALAQIPGQATISLPKNAPSVEELPAEDPNEPLQTTGAAKTSVTDQGNSQDSAATRGQGKPVETEPEPQTQPAIEQVAMVGEQSAAGQDAASDTARESAEKDESRKLLKHHIGSQLEAVDQALRSLSPAREALINMQAPIDRALELRNKAIEARDAGDLASADRLLKRAMEDVGLALKHEQEQFHLSMEVANKAYSAENAEQAQDAVTLAARLRPDDSRVLELQTRIKVLPELKRARTDVQNARIAGDEQDELAALERLLAIDPQNSQALARTKEIRQIQRDRNFSKTVAQAYAAIDNRDLKAAKDAVAQATKMRPSDSETKMLKQQLASLEKDLNLRKYLEAARQESEKDNWPGALDNYRRALAVDPQNAQAANGSDFSAQIVDAQISMDNFLSRPERLKSPNIAKSAHQAVKDSTLLGTFSAKLRSAASNLETAIAQWQTPVPIKIVSDGNTQIGVRRVGRIGTTTERIIELKPGTYQFEGKRTGYKSILIDVVVELNDTSMQEISVVCTEPI